jgi:hypothetical protein
MRLSKTSLARMISEPILHQVQSLLSGQFTSVGAQLDHQLMLQGRALAVQNAQRSPLSNLQEAEFKVFSQYGEDGILQYLIREAGITRDEQIFIEFGVQNYLESNTRFLLQNDHWKGLIIDGSNAYMESVKRSELYWRHDITALAAWIDRDNINDLFLQSGFRGQIGILSIDIDGNDYWVWESIEAVNPVIVVVEWNSVFGPDHAVSIPYDPAFDRASAHYSCLYWGASMAAFETLAERKGYALLGSNKVGNNLFFVRRDRLGSLQPQTTRWAYVESRFRDSRDNQGRLNFLSGRARYDQIKDLPVMDVITNTITTLSTLEESC